MQRQQQQQQQSGFVKKITKHGDGRTYPKKGQHVTVHYIGTLMNGQKFDSSVDKREPFTFQIGIGEVIRGWDEGVARMSLGERATLFISPEYGYGNRGAGNLIPPNAQLIFDVQLLNIQ